MSDLDLKGSAKRQFLALTHANDGDMTTCDRNVQVEAGGII